MAQSSGGFPGGATTRPEMALSTRRAVRTWAYVQPSVHISSGAWRRLLTNLSASLNLTRAS